MEAIPYVAVYKDGKDTDPRPISYDDCDIERQRKVNYTKKYPKRLKLKKPRYKY